MNPLFRLLLPVLVLATLALLGACRHRPYRGGPYYGGPYVGGPLYADPFFGGPYRAGVYRGFHGAPPGYWANVGNPSWRRYPPDYHRPVEPQPRPSANPNRAGSGGAGTYKPARVINGPAYAGGGPRGGSRSAITRNMAPGGRAQIAASRGGLTTASRSGEGGGGGGGRRAGRR